MSKPKYKIGRQICSIAEFDDSDSRFYIVFFGSKPKTLHKSFLISWQYQLLRRFIVNGKVYEAELIAEENKP